eukprot:10415938-Prorocentrum_lima.AAC.1
MDAASHGRNGDEQREPPGCGKCEGTQSKQRCRVGGERGLKARDKKREVQGTILRGGLETH